MVHADQYEPGNMHIKGDLDVEGTSTFAGDALVAMDGVVSDGDSGMTVTGTVAAGALKSAGATVKPPAADQLTGTSITGSLSTVSDSPAKALLTSMLAALVALGATDSTS